MAGGSWNGPWSDRGSSPAHPVSWSKIKLGWVSDVQTIDKGQIMQVLVDQLETNTSGIHAIKIQITSHTYYLVEVRRKVGYDAYLPGEGVLILYVDDWVASGDGPVRVKDRLSMIGQTFNDSSIGLTITIVSEIGSSFQVEVDYSPWAYFVNVEHTPRIFYGDQDIWNFTVYNENAAVDIFGRAWFFFKFYLNGSLWWDEYTDIGYPTWRCDKGTSVTRSYPVIPPDGPTMWNVTVELYWDKDGDFYLQEVYTFKIRIDVKVVIDETFVSDERVDIGTVQTVGFHVKWRHNGSDVVGGIIYVNGTEYITNGTGWANLNVVYDHVGKLIWTIIGVNCSGMNEFENFIDDPYIIWDRLNVSNHGVTDNRTDIGTSERVWVRVKYEYDEALFDAGKGSLRIGGQTASWNTSNLYWFITVVEDQIQRKDYSTPSSLLDTAYGLTALSGTVSQNITWDLVQVVLQSVDERINVGNTASIVKLATYGYDGTPFVGSIVLNDTLYKNVIGKFGYTCESVTDGKYELNAYMSNKVYVIYDKVSIILEVIGERASVEKTATVKESAIYQYDGATYDGIIVLNDTLTKPTVGQYDYTVEKIESDPHNITVFVSNVISIIFDRVNIQLSIEDARINAGETVIISWFGTYEYDNAIFMGSVLYNDTLTKDGVGKYGYTAQSIDDPVYGITTFTSDSVSCVFDRLEVYEYGVSDDRGDIGSKQRVWVKARYAYDDVIFDNAKGNISIGSIEAEWDGNSSYWCIDASQNMVTGIDYSSPSGFTDFTYGLTSIAGFIEQSIVWDRISITMNVLDDRINVGNAAALSWIGIYEYDDSEFFWHGHIQ